MLFHGGIKEDLLTATPPSLIAVNILSSVSFFISVELVWSLGDTVRKGALTPVPFPLEP
jgi:hypothetical protein